MKKNKKYKELYKLSKKPSILEADFKKKLIILAICLVPIVLLVNEKGPLRLVVIPFFLYGMIQLISIVISIPFLLEKYFPTKTYNKQATFFEKTLYYFTGIYLIGSIVFLLSQSKILENTIGESSIFWKYGGIGFGISIVALILLSFVSKTIYNDFNRRVAIWFCIPLGSFVLLPAIISISNTIINPKQLNCSKFQVIQKFTSGRRSSNYKIKLMTDYGEENFKIGESFYSSITDNEIIECCSYTGKLGYKVIVDFNKKESNFEN